MTERWIAITAAWLAFCLALGLALPQPPRPLHLALGALAGAVLVLGGFSAAARWRRVAVRHPRERLRLAGLSLLAGAALGAILLALLVAFARVEPAVGARFAGRLAEPAWRPWALGFESSILEEVSFRLFAMSVIAWVASRRLRSAAAAPALALGLSALLFGLAHLPTWFSATSPTAALVAGVLALNGLASLRRRHLHHH